MSARVLAAATPVLKAMDSGSSAYQIAYTAIEAADQIMFSEAAIERAAKAMYEAQTFNTWDALSPRIKPLWIRSVRAVVAALREEA